MRTALLILKYRLLSFGHRFAKSSLLARLAIPIFVALMSISTLSSAVGIYAMLKEGALSLTAPLATSIMSHTLTLFLLLNVFFSGALGPRMLVGGFSGYGEPAADLDYLFPSPVRPKHIFIAERLFYAVIPGTILAALSFGAFLAVGMAFSIPIWRVVVSFLSFFACYDALSALTYLFFFLQIRPRFRRAASVLRATAALVAAALLPALVTIVLSFVIPTSVPRWLKGFSSTVQGIEAVLPSGLAARASVGFMMPSGVPAGSYISLSLLLIEVAAINWLTASLSDVPYYEEVTGAAMRLEAKLKGIPLSMPRLRAPTIPPDLLGLRGGIRALYVKDRAIVARQEACRGLLTSSIAIASLVTVAVVSLPSLLAEEGPAQGLVFGLVPMSLLFALMASASLFGLERGSFSYVRSSPVDERNIVLSKFVLVLPYFFAAMLPLAVGALTIARPSLAPFLPTLMLAPPVLCAASLLSGIIQPMVPTKRATAGESLIAMIVLGIITGISVGPLVAMAILVHSPFSYIVSGAYSLAATYLLLGGAAIRLRGSEKI